MFTAKEIADVEDHIYAKVNFKQNYGVQRLIVESSRDDQMKAILRASEASNRAKCTS